MISHILESLTYFFQEYGEMLLEGIRELAFDLGQGGLIDIQGHGLVALLENERPHIVQPPDVILVLVGDENGIQMAHPLAKHLLAEVGTCVDGHRYLLGLHQNRRPGALVARVGGLTNRTLTPDNRDTLRSTAA